MSIKGQGSGGAGGGTNTPGAPNTSVQFNNGGSFAGDSNLTWVGATGLTNKKHAAFGATAVIDVETFTGTPSAIVINVSETLTTNGVGIENQIKAATDFPDNAYNAFFFIFSDPAGATDISANNLAANMAHYGSGNMVGGLSISSFFTNQGSGPVTYFNGYYCYGENGVTSSNVITDMWGVYIDSFANLGTGSITNTYGILVASQSAGTGINRAIKTGTGLVEFGDDIVMANGQGFGPTTTNAQTAILRAYDVDGAAYKTFATLTNGNTPDFSVVPPAGATITLQATTYKSSDGTSGATAGPFTTISSIQVKNGLVTTLTGS